MTLTKTRGFIPFLLVAFFNAFLDLGHKVLIQNTLYQTSGPHEYTILSATVNAFILLPYILLFTPSGFLADKFAKASVLRITALINIGIALLMTVCYYLGLFWLAFIFTLIFGTQSAINSPAKYGYIKEAFGKRAIAQANAYIQAVVIIAILAGTFVFTLLFAWLLHWHHIPATADKTTVLQAFAPLGFLLVLLAITEAILAFRLPQQAAADPNSTYTLQDYVQAKKVRGYLHDVSQQAIIRICIIGLSVFWAINQVLLAGYGAYLKQYTDYHSVIFAQGSLAIAGIGVLLGAMYAGRSSRGFIETGLIPLGCIGVTIGLFLMPHLTGSISILALFLIYGFFGGLLIVPLNALIQFHAPKNRLGKVLAANNLAQNIAMLSFLIATILLTESGANAVIIIVIMSIIALVGTVYAIYRLPQSLVRYVVYYLVYKFYRVSVWGLDNIPSRGGVLLLGNHTSYLDWAIIQITCPRPVRFVMNRQIYNKWYLKQLFRAFKVIPISTTGSKTSLDNIRSALDNGDVVAIFPEGFLSRNGQLGSFHPGFEKAATGLDITVIPFYLRGLWGSMTSLAPKRQRVRANLRDISITYGEAVDPNIQAATLKNKIFELSIKAWSEYSASLTSIPDRWVDRAKAMGNQICLIDSSGKALSHHELLSAVGYFSRRLKPACKEQHNIAILLPPSAAGVITNLAILCLAKTVVNINYTTHPDNILYNLNNASVKIIITSELFIHKLQQRGIDLASVLADHTIIYLENLRGDYYKAALLFQLLKVKLLPRWLLKKCMLRTAKVSDVAAILFSSGSEGRPKGIELTHRNILGNSKQIISVLNPKPNERILCILPLFHAFGLASATLMPLLEGIGIICHPDPTDSVTIGKLAYQHQATILIGTSSFFSLYVRNKKLDSLMFKNIRLVIAGAEKLNHNVMRAFKDKFGLTIYEGYGTTEVAPVASSNFPDILCSDDWHVQKTHKVGTVGLPLPGSAFRIVDPDTLEPLPIGTPGMILIGGTQVMKGYLNDPIKTNQVLIRDGDITWYKSGDKGFLDADGFLTIVDRYSRFAKVAGEMVSLSAVERQVTTVIDHPELDLMIVAIADARKGEQLVLLYTANDLSADQLRQQLLASDINKLMLPAHYLLLDELPRLGSGKKDYVRAKQVARELLCQ